MESKITHFLYVPFTGLGLYGGHRGKRWLRNRIKIFKQFVVPSLNAQTCQDFVLWVSWRHEERQDPDVKELLMWLNMHGFLGRVAFTYSGVCFWDDKYPDDIAYERLVNAVHESLGTLHNFMGEADEILMTLQPSDDCYALDAVKGVQKVFQEVPDLQAVGFRKGYVMDYINRRLAEWNPTTIPPFFTIKFPRKTFIDPRAHLEYTGPYKSHENIADKLKFGSIYDVRGFLVGTHGENISTIFNHPFAGPVFEDEERERILANFGLQGVADLRLSTSIRRKIMRRLPYGWQRKLRYLLGERFYARFYNFIRS